jgi:hypothetical protein
MQVQTVQCQHRHAATADSRVRLSDNKGKFTTIRNEGCGWGVCRSGLWTDTTVSQLTCFWLQQTDATPTCESPWRPRRLLGKSAVQHPVRTTVLFRIKALIAAVIKCASYWYIRTCHVLMASRRFGGTRHLRLQGRRINETRKQLEAGSKQILVFLSPIKQIRSQ